MCTCMQTVAPDAFYKNVKTRKDQAKNMHYVAPEYAGVYICTCVLAHSASLVQCDGCTGRREALYETMPVLFVRKKNCVHVVS